MPAHVYGNMPSKTFMILLHGGPGGNGLRIPRWQVRGRPRKRNRGGILGSTRARQLAWQLRIRETLDMDLLLDDLDQLVVMLLNIQYGDDINLFLYGHSWGGTYGTKYLMSEARQAQFNGWIESNGAHTTFQDSTLKQSKCSLRLARMKSTREITSADWQEIVDFAKGVDTTNISEDEGGQINQHGHKAGGTHRRAENSWR